MESEKVITIKRAGCFEGKVKNPKAICLRKDVCDNAEECIWTKRLKDVAGLGTVPSGRGKMLRSR